MKRFNHPNVINLIGVCTDAGPAPYIVMPFMANGSLLSYLKQHRSELMLPDTADEDVVRTMCWVYIEEGGLYMQLHFCSAIKVPIHVTTSFYQGCSHWSGWSGFNSATFVAYIICIIIAYLESKAVRTLPD